MIVSKNDFLFLHLFSVLLLRPKRRWYDSTNGLAFHGPLSLLSSLDSHHFPLRKNRSEIEARVNRSSRSTESSGNNSMKNLQDLEIIIQVQQHIYCPISLEIEEL